MYIPSHFKQEDLAAVKSFIRENSFGILINQLSQRITASHIPLELATNKEGKDILEGHISKANPQWESFPQDQEVLAIFHGPHAYVSSSWYDHENVPTWNYIAVHIYGKLKIVEGEALYASLKRLLDKYEVDSKNPVTIEGMSENTLRQMKGIVGFEIEIHEVQAAYKLSQNRNHQDYHNIIEHLDQKNQAGSKETAQQMRNIVSKKKENN